jgi:hypothetical protein
MFGAANDLRGAVFGVADALSELGAAGGAALLNIVSSLPNLLALAAAFTLLASALGSALAAALLLGAVLADLLGFFTLLPGALSVILAIILPLVIGFHNLGDALGLVFEKDPDKLAQGLAKLSTPMRALVASLRSVAPVLTQIQNSVQTALITPILETLAPTLRDLGPLLARGFSQVASVVGIFIRDLLTLLDSPVFRQLLTDLFPATARIISALAGPALRLIEAFALAADKMLPNVEALATSFGNLLVKFADWITTSVENGSFQKFLSDAQASLAAIWNLVSALISLFGAMFGQVNGDGRKFLDIITQAITQFREWVTSPDGIRALQGAIDLAKIFGISFGAALIVVQQIFSWIGRIDSALRTIIGLLRTVQGLQSGIGGGLKTGGFKSAPQFADGGFTGQSVTPAILHPQEVVIPLTKPARAQQLMAEAGLWNMGGGDQPINVYVGGKQLDMIVDYHVQRGNRANATALANGPRR